MLFQTTRDVHLALAVDKDDLLEVQRCGGGTTLREREFRRVVEAEGGGICLVRRVGEDVVVAST